MAKKIRIKFKTKVESGGENSPVKPYGKPSSGILTEKILIAIEEEKKKKQNNDKKDEKV